MEFPKIRVVKGNRVKFVTKDVAEGAAVRNGYVVEDDKFELINGKIVPKVNAPIAVDLIEVKEEATTEEALVEEKEPTKADILSKYLPDFVDDGKVNAKEVITVIEACTKEEADIIMEGETRKSVIQAYQNK